MDSLQPHHRPSCLPFSSLLVRIGGLPGGVRCHFPTRLGHLISGSWRQAARRATALPLPEERVTEGAFFLGTQTGSVAFEPLLGHLLSV